MLTDGELPSEPETEKKSLSQQKPEGRAGFLQFYGARLC
jgi:hypothetical protein